MTLVPAILVAILQSVTEFLPVSSQGHAILFPQLIAWNFDPYGRQFLPFRIMLHFGTAAALLTYFWRDWYGLATSILDRGGAEEREVAVRLVRLIAVATIPAAIGAFLIPILFQFCANFPFLVSGLFIINGIALIMCEHLRSPSGDRHIEDMSWREALVIGLWQSAAIVPGISRTGMTVGGGIVMRFPHGEAAHFSFLIATPLVLGTALLDLPQLVSARIGISGIAWLAGAVAAIAAYFSISFILSYFRDPDSASLDPFAYYCGLVGMVSLYVILFMQ